MANLIIKTDGLAEIRIDCSSGITVQTVGGILYIKNATMDNNNNNNNNFVVDNNVNNNVVSNKKLKRNNESDDEDEDEISDDDDDDDFINDDDDDDYDIEIVEATPEQLNLKRKTQEQNVGKKDSKRYELNNCDTFYEQVWRENGKDIIKSPFYKTTVYPVVSTAINTIGNDGNPSVIEFRTKILFLFENPNLDIQISEFKTSVEDVCSCCAAKRILSYKWTVLGQKRMENIFKFGSECHSRLKALFELYHLLYSYSNQGGYSKGKSYPIATCEEVYNAFTHSLDNLKNAFNLPLE